MNVKIIATVASIIVIALTVYFNTPISRQTDTERFEAFLIKQKDTFANLYHAGRECEHKLKLADGPKEIGIAKDSDDCYDYDKALEIAAEAMNNEHALLEGVQDNNIAFDEFSSDAKESLYYQLNSSQYVRSILELSKRR